MNGKARVIEMVKPANAGGDIIRLKDQIHTLWYELQATKRANKDYAFLMKPVYDEIVRLGHEALETLEAVDPLSRFIKRIEGPLHETQRKSWLADDIAFIGPKPYYVMSPEAGRNVITQDINRLANEVHNAGMSLIKASSQYCGCNVASSVTDLSSINTGVLKYCEGALQGGMRKAWIFAPGDKVEHKPGSAAGHANIIRFTPTEKGSDVLMDYSESGDENWRLRLDGVVKIVEEKGGKCEESYMATQCKIPDASGDEILNLALLMSQLVDIDLLSRDCIPLAFQLIAEQAEELKKVKSTENIWKEPWTRPRDMNGIMECSEVNVIDDEERERVERLLAERLRRSIQFLDERIDVGIQFSKEDPCVASPYDALTNYNFAREIRDECDKLKKETTEPFGWCMTLADEREQDIKNAAENLVERCPPEGIILGLEAEGSTLGKYYIDRIGDICRLIDDQDCLKIIRQVELRGEQGVKAEKLTLIGTH